MNKDSGLDLIIVKKTCDTIRKEVGKVVVGYQDVIEDRKSVV